MRQIENIADLGRVEVIDELRYVARPTWFHQLLELSTPMLKAILMFYHTGGDDSEVINMIKENTKEVKIFSATVIVKDKCNNEEHRVKLSNRDTLIITKEKTTIEGGPWWLRPTLRKYLSSHYVS